MADATAAMHPTEHIDPVCGMTVDPAEAAGSSAYRGQTYYFCHPSCLERFEAAPAAFLGGDGAREPATPAAVPGARSYVCPMDPEIRQTQPGSCPKCGMALEPDLSDRVRADEGRIHLPDAPRDRPRRTGRVPDLRDGARAARRRASRTSRIPS